MKKAFTLVELLIVVVVLVTLMSMTFKLSSIGADQSARNTAVSRLQRLENCLSGYYAAFGTYPPVRLHGSRNYKLGACIHGIQGESEQDLNWDWFDSENHQVKSGSSENELKDWKKVEAACKAQPLGCSFPYPDDWSDFLSEISTDMAKGSSKLNFSALTTGAAGGYNDEAEWRHVQIFKFGLMSFLLPRYLVMMRGDESLYNDQDQWLENNALPCNPLTGDRFDDRAFDDPRSDWGNLRSDANSTEPMDIARVENIPSQAACARWVPNLEGICQYNRDDRKFFGIDIRDQESKDNAGFSIHRRPELHVLGDEGGNCQQAGASSGGSSGGQYVLDAITVYDGFAHSDEDGDGLTDYSEFFYYSPEPYQSYVLWSAGPNGRTFPPWVPRESLTPAARACVGYWTEDDIVIMSH